MKAAAGAASPKAVEAKASANLGLRARSGVRLVLLVLLVLLAAGLVLWRVVAH